GGHIQSAGDRLRNFGQSKNLAHVRVAKVNVKSERSVLRKLALSERGAGIKVPRGVAMNDGPVVRGEMIGGELDGSGECIPVNNFGGDLLVRRHDGVKVVDFEIAGDGKRGEFAAGVAGKTRPAVNRKGQVRRAIVRRAIGRFEERRPFSQVVAGERESER